MKPAPQEEYIEERLKAEIVTEALKTIAAPSQRREMARWAVADNAATVKMACRAFGISQICYRYKAKLDAENVPIADC
jgi:hypothetical protein